LDDASTPIYQQGSMTRITLLGTGTSSGVPVIGCHCDVCQSTDPRDKRGRTSAVVYHQNRVFLIDTATELRIQALANALDRIDTVLFTHAHADHTGGFDDLRRFNEIEQRHIDVFAAPETASILRERFAYAFEDVFPFYGGKPDLNLIEVTGPFEVDGIEIVPVPVLHGRMGVLGFRFDTLAYVTDAKQIPDESMALLMGLDLLVMNALRERPHPTHLSISEAVSVIGQLKPKRALLTHLSHEISHMEASALVPDGVEIGYDGLSVST
jgi:phosphoribosyl 1,2-cyclic phosphate phosphodiesterase